MPSGSKKRKAAKKKKENHPNTHLNPPSANAHTRGDEDAEHQDSKDGDNGRDDVSSTSHDPQDNQEHLTEGDEEEIDDGEKNSHLLSEEGLKDDVSVVSNIVTEELGVPIEGEFKIDDEPKKENGGLEHGDESRRTNGAGDEPHEVRIPGEREFVVEDEVGEQNGRFEHDDENLCSNGDPVDSEKAADILSVGYVDDIHTIQEAGYSVTADIPEVVSQEIQCLVGTAEENLSSPAHISAAHITESINEENKEKIPSSDEENICISAGPEDVSTVQEETYLQSVKSTSPVPSSKEIVAIRTDDRSSLIYNATIGSADNGADRDRDSSLTKPLLAPFRPPVQTASWKNCCGLFEVFSGSGQ